MSLVFGSSVSTVDGLGQARWNYWTDGAAGVAAHLQSLLRTGAVRTVSGVLHAPRRVQEPGQYWLEMPSPRRSTLSPTAPAPTPVRAQVARVLAEACLCEASPRSVNLSCKVALCCGFSLHSLDHKGVVSFFAEGPAENVAHFAAGSSSLIGRVTGSGC